MFLGSQISNAQTPPIDAGVSRELARWRAAHYSDVRYKLNLTLEKMSLTLKGSIEISLKNDADQIVLDWRKIRGKEDLSTISSVSVNGRFVSLNSNPSQLYTPKYIVEGDQASYFETNEHLVFKEGVKTGENVIKLNFTSPIATSGAAVTRYVDKEDGAEYIYSLFVPSDASAAFPVFDQPDLKARFILSITTPPNWNILTNTEVNQEFRIETTHCSKDCVQKQLVFNQTEPISTYVFAFAAGDFQVFRECLSLEEVKGKEALRCLEFNSEIQENREWSKIYVRKSQAEKFKQYAAEVFRLNREAVKYLESYFDYKFPFPKYDLVLIPEFPFGGMEHAGATFLRESSIIFPQEPTANDYISRGNLIFHEAAHQWFGDAVTMRWFDDLWLKEGFAEFMAYKTMEKVLPQYNAWKAFYERNKPLAYLTDSTKGTTPIYQEIPNLSSAKSAYGNIVYRKAPSFLKQAEFYLGADKFQTAVRAFLKQNAFKNAEWQDLVKSFEAATKKDLKDWANSWVTKRGMPIISKQSVDGWDEMHGCCFYSFYQKSSLEDDTAWRMKSKFLQIVVNTQTQKEESRAIFNLESIGKKTSIVSSTNETTFPYKTFSTSPFFRELSGELSYYVYFPNYEDYGYGIFLLDERSRNYVLANIQNEKDDFLRSMMWGALWDSVREAELNPKDYVELAVKNISGEKDELTIQTILSRVSTAMNYYLGEKRSAELAPRLEKVLLERMNAAETLGQRIVFYRSFLNLAASAESRQKLKEILSGKFEIKDLKLKTKDKFDIVTRLLILNDADAPKLLGDLAKTETSDEAKRYAYAARAGIATAENKGKFFADFLNNKEISESYIETAVAPFNSVRHAEMTLPFLEKALAELPNLKRTRKIFFVNNWLGAFIGGQRSEQALAIVNKFLADNPNLDRDLRLKILENVDGLERSVKIRKKFAD
ncbi:MAG TPA: M1 family aminopeptidase [Pyrinomonadaceae bacterium]|jgi:aminopeptidase N